MEVYVVTLRSWSVIQRFTRLLLQMPGITWKNTCALIFHRPILIILLSVPLLLLLSRIVYLNSISLRISPLWRWWHVYTTKKCYPTRYAVTSGLQPKRIKQFFLKSFQHCRCRKGSSSRNRSQRKEDIRKILAVKLCCNMKTISGHHGTSPGAYSQADRKPEMHFLFPAYLPKTRCCCWY